MQNFTKRIQIEQGSNPEFFFSRIYTLNGVRYHISVIDKQQQAFGFNIEMEKGKWKILDTADVPDWINNIEKKLEEIIFDNMTNG